MIQDDSIPWIGCWLIGKQRPDVGDFCFGVEGFAHSVLLYSSKANQNFYYKPNIAPIPLLYRYRLAYKDQTLIDRMFVSTDL